MSYELLQVTGCLIFKTHRLKRKHGAYIQGVKLKDLSFDMDHYEFGTPLNDHPPSAG